jgi:hypothetical protein
MVLNILIELSQIIPNSVVNLIDIEGNGILLYQTSDWDVQSDLSKFILDWRNSAPSVQLNEVKYATIKAIKEDIFIGTNVQGYGHILSKFLNPLTALLIRMPREQDPLDIEDMLPDYIARIANVFNS